MWRYRRKPCDRFAARACAARRRGARAFAAARRRRSVEVVVHGDADSSKVIGRRIEDISLPEERLGAVVAARTSSLRITTPPCSRTII